jgi:hypothetical protein
MKGTLMRKLSLHREHLTDLTPGELVDVVGASGVTCAGGAAGCLKNLSDQVRACDSYLRTCISGVTCYC